ncbi:organic hydroperoxide resistance protein [Conexibacter sp. JD483]|uniref:organic hydroperoxide resistance protein n=1 Tax=unclassified Conexibacter TaxID=2627773 RepID=UPI002718A056|nr:MULTISPECIES: organic hydroperoxide resistance protein [unclassified Conexibacter]MDO8184699.1 organic hydroperoxide resistance protein [Conexibacter sp. CPCC 205706]MDO8198005.1 organic hydroperoxide resistance protein [Conexibacter sp. CPCC 205762]MDR9368435.1 organic hydroperoxide resistance protein [Conexibacter sp. JD483]
MEARRELPAIDLDRALYTAEATVRGGRSGQGRTSDGALTVELRPPREMGGDGEPGTNPEQLFAIGYAACFEGALGVAARRRALDADDASIDARVHLLPTGDGRFTIAVDLDVTLPSVGSVTTAVELTAAAREICPYSNATRGNVRLRLTANGAAV